MNNKVLTNYQSRSNQALQPAVNPPRPLRVPIGRPEPPRRLTPVKCRAPSLIWFNSIAESTPGARAVPTRAPLLPTSYVYTISRRAARPILRVRSIIARAVRAKQQQERPGNLITAPCVQSPRARLVVHGCLALWSIVLVRLGTRWMEIFALRRFARMGKCNVLWDDARAVECIGVRLFSEAAFLSSHIFHG